MKESHKSTDFTVIASHRIRLETDVITGLPCYLGWQRQRCMGDVSPDPRVSMMNVLDRHWLIDSSRLLTSLGTMSTISGGHDALVGVACTARERHT